MVKSLKKTKTSRRGSRKNIPGCKKTRKKLGRVLQDKINLRQAIKNAVEDNRKIKEELGNSLKRLKEVQAQLIHAEKMEAVGRMASGVAHEVKNPLGIILQCINYLEEELPPEQKDNHQMLEMMKNSAKRADKIVRTLLSFSRAEELKAQEQDINAVIESSIGMVQDKLKFNSVEIIYQLAESLPKLLVDRDKIEQVFINLFNNAADAMPKGGKLYVRSYLTELKTPKDKIGNRGNDIFKLGENAVIVEVEDTGEGIKEDNLNKIFDPFFTTKKRMEGTGLGLWVVKSIIEMHKSLINVESKSGQGTKFTVIFKISDEMRS
ncbi:MAG: ATP-binding protein [Candidatus Omnitrophica bacterium]|nr:ATP-binding protein [Candidatus Omnitrophota bacterium]